MNMHFSPPIVSDGPIYPIGEDDMGERLHRTGRLALIWIVAFVLLIVTGATVVQIGGAVIGQGALGVETRVKQITHPSGGVVKAIYVHDGQHVKQGQLLLQLDNAVSGVNATLSGETVEHLMAQRARLSVEAAGGDVLDFPPELTNSANPSAQAAVAAERQLFRVRQGERASMRAQLAERVRQQEAQISGYEAQIAALRKQKVLIEPERTGVKELWQKGLVTIGRMNQLERNAVDLDSSVAALRAQIAQTRAHISETREQMIALGQTARSEAGAQLEQVSLALNDQQAKSASASDQFRRSEIRAPYEGIVDQLAVSTVGGVIDPSKTLMEIIPTGQTLLVEAAISPVDIARVRTGQTARVRLSAFNARTTAEIPGEVVFVSANRVTNPSTGVAFYRVHVRMDPVAIRRQGLQLKPGMPAEVFIGTGARSMVSYLFKPLQDQLARAFRD